MDITILSKILEGYGTNGVIIIAFITLVVWTVKRYEKLQDKLYNIIEALSSELPTIRKSLEDIKQSLNRKE